MYSFETGGNKDVRKQGKIRNSKHEILPWGHLRRKQIPNTNDQNTKQVINTGGDWLSS
jgi:hypothetical protein